MGTWNQIEKPELDQHKSALWKRFKSNLKMFLNMNKKKIFQKIEREKVHPHSIQASLTLLSKQGNFQISSSSYDSVTNTIFALPLKTSKGRKKYKGTLLKHWATDSVGLILE